MRRIALAGAIVLAAVTNLWGQAGQLPAWNVLGNPSAAASNARSASLNALFNGAFCSTANAFVARVGGSWVCQGPGTGLSFSGGNLNIANTTVTPNSYGSATQCVALTVNAQGQLTAASAVTCTPAFSSLTGTPTTLAGYGITSPLPYAQGGCNATTQAGCTNNIFPTPTRAGDVAYWNGSAWTTLAGNNSGTQVFSENSSGVPAWSAAGSGTVNAGAGNLVPTSGSPTSLFVEQMNPGGRLTLVSGVPVMTTDQAAITSIWYAPYTGRWVPVYDGTDMKLRNFTSSATDTVGLSIAMAGSANFPASTIFSTFVGLDSGTLRLCTTGWTNSGVGTSSRGTGGTTPELELFDGILTNKNALNCRYSPAAFFSCAVHQCTYVGDFKTNGSTGTVDMKGLSGSIGAGGVAGCICVYNAYNQVRGNAFIGDSTANWAYTLAAYRQADGSAGNQILVLQGALGSIFSATNSTAALNSTTAGLVVAAGIGLDSTTVNSAQRQTLNQTQVAGLIVANEATLQVNLAAGLHNITRLESSGASGVTTWVGTAGGVQTGMIADFWW